MKTLGVVLIVVLLLLGLLPLGVGMAMGSCPIGSVAPCGSVAGACLILGSMLVLLVWSLGVGLSASNVRPRVLLLVSSLDKPPRPS